MLTKEERAAIAERLKSAGRLTEFTFYEALTGKQMAPSWDLRAGEISNIIVDLCDTSNMVEFPVDKDGEIIKLDDTVYSKYGTKCVVDGLGYYKERTAIYTHTVDDFISGTYYDFELTHKNPVTIKSLVKELTDLAAADYGTPMVVKRKLSDIADQLESLGDNDE